LTLLVISKNERYFNYLSILRGPGIALLGLAKSAR
jgi:hypothetical protein